jgi:hypothetical protein
MMTRIKITATSKKQKSRLTTRKSGERRKSTIIFVDEKTGDNSDTAATMINLCEDDNLEYQV